MALTQAAIVSALQSHWRNSLGIDLPTLFPGIPANTAETDAWFEFWVDLWSHPARRKLHPDRFRIAVTVHAFAKSSLNLGRIHELAHSARAALEHQTIEIRDRTLPDEPLIGHITLHEPDLRDLSRNQAPHAGDHLQHLTLTLEGEAKEL